MAEIISKSNNEVIIQVKLNLTGTMLEMENIIQSGVNEVGVLATKEALLQLDSSGLPIKIGTTKLTSKGKVLKEYQTPYGAVSVDRYVYQTSSGGKTYCPLDDKARIIISSTPKFAQMISYKYASLSARELSEDLELNHGRAVTRGFIQKVADMVGSIAEASEEIWEYETPEQNEPVATVALSLDGTCILMKDDGYREAMTGNVSLYNPAGDRLHTIYIGATPEYGKQKFVDRLQHEVDQIKLKYPDANYIGVADGAKFNWEFLERNADFNILDFYHATEYLAAASYSFTDIEKDRRAWLNEACHRLKHDDGAAKKLLTEMKQQKNINASKKKITKIVKDQLDKSITYFTNQLLRMNYSEYVARNFPIGSGVTEAACKTLIKQRLCRSAMQWRDKGAAIVIALRSLVQTTGRWSQFWNKINLCGINDLELV
jgi:hypothetical protein